MNLNASVLVGSLIFLVGAALIAVGALSQGRSVRPLLPRRARAMAWREYGRALARSAELAVAQARDAAGRGEPAVVTVEDVVRLADERFGYDEVVWEDAAAALRHAYERAGCAADCVTDAYSAIR
ncbi:hypothetical protein [Streptomyces sp. NPDC090025]|uniref:hypothetical protein n=1 Tax=Streptomyces sp. NPDC090025 TaxID=3365922 RepID=UPI003839856D